MVRFSGVEAAGVRASISGVTAMIGLFAALIAVYLGAAGPPFRWRGACLLAGFAVAIGVVASISGARDAAERGLVFLVTPGSLVLGLLLQAAFMLTFYAMAALARWSARGLTTYRPPIPQPDSES